jgi:predicted DNA-binding WGR domain protein
MSVNLHLSIRVAGYNPAHRKAIVKAVKDLIEAEDLQDDLPALVEVEEGGVKVLLTRSDPENPVIISSSYRWVPEIQAALTKAVTDANQEACSVKFEDVDADTKEGRALKKRLTSGVTEKPSKPKPSKSKAKTTDSSQARRFEFRKDGSSKSWQIWTDGTTLTTRWGKIGTDGQEKTKDFGSEEKVKLEYDRLIKEKTDKGYLEQ